MDKVFSRKIIKVDEVVDFLNHLLKIDRRAIENLFNTRVFCNKKLAKHKTVQCGKIGENTYFVGFIGILNGLFGVDDDGWGKISMDVGEGKIKQFRLIADKDKKNIKDKNEKKNISNRLCGPHWKPYI